MKKTLAKIVVRQTVHTTVLVEVDVPDDADPWAVADTIYDCESELASLAQPSDPTVRIVERQPSSVTGVAIETVDVL